MTVQAFRLLRKLKKSQMNLNELVYIDYDAMTASTIHESGKPFEKVNLKAYRTSLDSTLRYLFERKYIDYDGDHSVVQVLHSGWHLGQTMLSNFLGFLFKSVFVPIVVSLLTTLITLWITSLLGA